MENKINKTKYRKYDDQFKQEALKQLENGQSVASVARALGISEALLYSWRKRLTVSSVGSNSEVDQLRKQIKQLMEIPH